MTGEWRSITTPLTEGVIESLKSGDRLLLTGTVFAARDKAHERLCSMAARGETLPIDPAGQLIYYMGPSPAPPGKIIGAAGPTTSSRMDAFTEEILKMGVKGMIGKGKRDHTTRELLAWHRAVYFATFGGAGSYLAKRITEATCVAFEDLGAEAVYLLRVERFPLIVINDIYGGDLYEDALQQRG